MKLLDELSLQAKIVYSVFFDQKWYWLNVRPRLDGRKGWLEYIKICLFMLLLAMLVITVSLPLYLALQPEQEWIRIYQGTLLAFGSVFILSMFLGIGKKNIPASSAPIMVTFGSMVAFIPHISAILVMPTENSPFIVVFLLFLGAFAGMIFSMSSVLVSGVGVIELISNTLKKSYLSISENDKLGRSCIIMVIIALFALVLVPIAMIFYWGWEMYVGTQTILAGIAILTGYWLGEKWATRQVKDPIERKRLANNPD